MDFSKLALILNETSITAIQTLLNKHIRQQSDVQQQLIAMEGKSCVVHIEPLPNMLIVRVSNGMLVLSMVQASSDVYLHSAAVKANGVSIVKLLLADDAKATLAEESVELQGQVYMFITLQRICRRLTIHWQRELESLFGSLLVGEFIAYCKRLYTELRSQQQQKYTDVNGL